MKFSITLDQRNYLNATGYISFFNLLNASEINILKGSLTKDKSRDLWRNIPSVKQVIFSKRLVDLVYELTLKKPIRYAFDLFIPEKEELKEIFGEEPLQNRMAINPLVGLFLIHMKTAEGYFILPTSTFPYESLEPGPYFLIGYGDKYSQYLYEMRDPNAHFLKSLGYVFGDRLNDSLHPILLR